METQGREGRTGKWATRLGVVMTLAVGILVGTLISNGVRAARDNNPAPVAQPLSIPSPVELSSVFGKVAKEVEPAVVNISTESIIAPRRRQRPRPNAPDLFDPFERFFDFEGPERFRESSLGSGVIVDPDGNILTNYHVVQRADKIEVQLAGETKRYPATVVGYDRETDLAVIRIDAGRKLPTAKMGNSDAAQVGDWVLAIGSPFGLEATVTAGIISYKGRPGMQQFQRFLQTDAAINHGNSGGPLVNLAGEVIGINTAIVSDRGGGTAGIGFALASNIAVEVYNEIVKHGRMVRGSIGISFRGSVSENEAILRSFGADHGVVVESVEPGGPAEKAGLRRGDVVTEVAGTSIRTGDDLVSKVAALPVGQPAAVRYLRDKKAQEATVVIEDRYKVFAEQFGEEPSEDSSPEASSSLGMTLEELTPAQATQYGLERDENGLIVTDVEPGSFADELGILPRDVILELNQQPVRSRRALLAIQAGLEPGDDVVFWIKRRVGNRWVGLYLGDPLPR